MYGSGCFWESTFRWEGGSLPFWKIKQHPEISIWKKRETGVWWAKEAEEGTGKHPKTRMAFSEVKILRPRGSVPITLPMSTTSHTLVQTADIAPTEALTRVAQPPFTADELKACIPAHCFERSYVKSLMHLGVDVLVVSALFWVAYRFCLSSLPGWTSLVFWPIYTFIQVCPAFHLTAHSIYFADRDRALT